MDASRLARRNFYLMICEGTFFWAALAFMQGDTVVSMFMNTMTGSVALAGLAATLRTVLFLVGEFVLGTFIHKIRKQSRFMTIVGFLSRPLILLMAPLLMMGLSGPSSAWVFLVLYGLLFFTDGFVGMIWVEIGARTLDPRRRGMVMAINPATGGFVGVFVAFFVRNVLGGAWAVNVQYAVIFGCAGALLLIDAVFLALFKDAPHLSQPDEKVLSLLPYVRRLITIFIEDKPVRMVTIARMFYLLTLISSSINILFGGSAGGLNELQQATLVFMPAVGQVAAGFLWSQVSRYLSYPILMLMSQLIGVMSAVMNLVSLCLAMGGYSVMIPLSIAMILISVNNSAYIGYTQHMISLVDEQKRPMYYVMTALITAPLALGHSIAAMVAERFGYLPIYLVMLAAGIAGASLVYVKFIRKPKITSPDYTL